MRSKTIENTALHEQIDNSDLLCMVPLLEGEKKSGIHSKNNAQIN